MVHKILIWPDPRLREKTREVERFDKALEKLIEDMFETMYAASGVGLAANQIGVDKRLAVIDASPKQEDTAPLVLINPQLVESQGEIVHEGEGCLSIPGEAEDVKRAEKVLVRALDRKGKPFELSAEGLLAIALQHELDHLDGILFVDHLSSLKREMIKRRMKRVKAERDAEKKKKE